MRVVAIVAASVATVVLVAWLGLQVSPRPPARLTVPFGEQQETFIVRFDPDTHRIRLIESMRYKGADSDTKTLWINEVVEWADVDGRTLPRQASPTWLDEGSPWATLTTDEVVYNADVATYVKRKGL